MKHTLLVYLTLLFICVCFAFSCKQNTNNRYAYDSNKDTIPPLLSITVPVNLDTYDYGEYIHIVGTLTDLESRNNSSQKAGKLKSLYLNISIIDNLIHDSIIKVLFVKSPNVDGEAGYTINEKTYLTSGVGNTYCRFKAIATDYADRKDSSTVYFTIH